MIQTTRQELEQIVGDAVTQAISERRKEAAPTVPTLPTVCFCSDPAAAARHSAEHEIMRRLGRFLDRVENAKWGFLMLVLAVIISGGFFALWEGIKSSVKGNG